MHIPTVARDNEDFCVFTRMSCGVPECSSGKGFLRQRDRVFVIPHLLARRRATRRYPVRFFSTS